MACVGEGNYREEEVGPITFVAWWAPWSRVTGRPRDSPGLDIRKFMSNTEDIFSGSRTQSPNTESEHRVLLMVLGAHLKSFAALLRSPPSQDRRCLIGFSEVFR